MDDKEEDKEEVDCYKGDLEGAVEEDVFRDKTPVDGPLVEELAAELKGTQDVALGVDLQERPGKTKLLGDGMG